MFSYFKSFIGWLRRDREVTLLRRELDEARMWAKHGYEIGQRSATWSDHGVAPRWLIDSYQ
jgi:hypothetical protein